MKKGTFTINGVTSQELNSLIQERPSIPSARRKVSTKSVPGISGDYVFDEEAWENVSFELSFFTVGKTEQEVNQLKDWITATFNTGDYVDLVLYHDQDYVYEVRVEREPEYEPDGRTPFLLPYTVGFSARPFKRLVYPDVYEGVTSLSINNPTPYTSEPEITLYGNGDMQLHVNGLVYNFKEIDEHVHVDSESQNAYKGSGYQVVNRNHRMIAMDFPTFKTGPNSVSVQGGATGFRVLPRWRMKL